MNIQNNFESNGQEAKNSTGKNVLVVLGSLLVLVLTALMFLGWFLTSFGCAFSGGFECRIIKPTLMLSTLIALVSGIMLIGNLIRYKTPFVKKHVLYIFIFSILVPLTLVIADSSLSKDQQAVYFDGMTRRSCSTGKSSLPWGLRPETDYGKVSYIKSCLSLHKLCVDSNSDSYNELCLIHNMDAYSTYNSPKNSDNYTEYNDCQSLKFNRDSCLLNVAIQKRDTNFCVSTSYSSNPRDRHFCAMRVSGMYPSPIYDFTSYFSISVDERVARCKVLGEVKTDLCLSSIMSNVSFVYVDVVCISISDRIFWLKQNCYELGKP